MTELGQQIARILAPERWREWDCDSYGIEHTPTGFRIYIGSYEFDPFLGPAFFKAGAPEASMVGGWWARRRLLRMAVEIKRRHHGARVSEAARELSAKLMTAEERAIEELLRP